MLVTKYSLTNSVADRARQSRPRLLKREHHYFIDNALTSNDELTTRQLWELPVQKYPELSASLSTIKRARYELGWVISSLKYCQLIGDINKEKRKAWCEKMIEEN